MTSILLIIAIILSLGGLLLLGVPVAFSLGLLSSVLMFFFWGGAKGLSVIAVTSFSQVTSFVLLAIPLFLIMSEAILVTGASHRGFRAVELWLSRLSGGIGVASNLFCTIFGAVTGFAPATIAAIGNIAVPEMIERKYDPKLALGLIGGGASLAILIPPSILMIMYGELAEVSVGKMFLGGIGPGLLASILFSIYILIVGKYSGKAPALGTTFSLKERLRALPGLLPLFGLIFVVLGTIWFGVCTPTEAAGAGAFVAVCLALAYRRLTLSKLRELMLRSVQISCMLYMIFIGAKAFTQILAYLGFIEETSRFVLHLGLSPLAIIVGMQCVLFVLGTIVDAGSIICITVPIFLPILKGIGYSPLMFGLTMMVNLCVATLTPPVGLNLYVLKSIAPSGMDVMEIAKGCVPFILLLVLTLTMLIAFPEIGLWLPNFVR